MRAHLSINVESVKNSVAFYEKIFNVSPQKQTEHYAKFDLVNPPLNFTMQTAVMNKSRVNHLGIEVDSAEEVNHWIKKLEDVGIASKIESKTDCCFARQDKVWFEDPDGNAWEVFYVYEQLPLDGPINKTEGSNCCTPSLVKNKTSCC